MDLNPYKSPSIASECGPGTSDVSGEFVHKKQRAIRVLVAINFTFVAHALGYFGMLQLATILLPGFMDAGNNRLVNPTVLALLLTVTLSLVSILGFIGGFMIAGRLFRQDTWVAWQLSLFSAICVGTCTAVATWHGANSAVAFGVTVLWVAIPHILRAKKII